MLERTTGSRDRDFMYLLVNELQTVNAMFAIDWVRKNFAVEEIFPEEDLHDWAVDNGYELKE